MSVVEPRPWYWAPVACLTLLGAGYLAFFAYLLRIIDCHEDTGSVCTTSGLVQLLIALAGLVPALGMMVQSLRGRGRPSYWFAATAVVYVTWAIYLWRWS